jgi:Flp pilus assembly protein TadG
MSARSRSERDRGTAGVDAAIAVTALLAMGMLIVGGLRITNARGDVQAAARSAARAAAGEYSAAEAAASANRVAAAALGGRGRSCGSMSVSVDGDLSAGSVVTVRVSCQVDLGDVVLGGFPGSSTVSGEAVEYVDVARGGL